MTKLQRRTGNITLQQLRELKLPRQKREALQVLITDYLAGKPLTPAQRQKLQKLCRRLGV